MKNYKEKTNNNNKRKKNKNYYLQEINKNDYIIQNSEIEKIKILLEEGISINYKDKDEKTILWWAVFNKNYELVHYLINKGAKSYIPDKLGKTPFELANQLALGGYREPGEENPYIKIIGLLNQKNNTNQDDIEALSKSMNNLGLHNNILSSNYSSLSLSQEQQQTNTSNINQNLNINKNKNNNNINGSSSTDNITTINKEKTKTNNIPEKNPEIENKTTLCRIM
ncbi:hypothetical protein DLAC_00361 [Tieghemostelium lacteum]|uniref:Uncharacterized protein n=1 Tax=Tieghemostelium lacteum TaxID=361077 RepID=A0A152A9J4_TIELA|nr:hypothetical protein DLAC_00361 [Tieghemostelium lacteum]|eukprot:KYR02884.1 hypothetical protein DLAC_00361 [Tieghemostelium lacteum]